MFKPSSVSTTLCLPICDCTNGIITQASFADDTKSGEKSPTSSDFADDNSEAVIAIPFANKEVIDSTNALLDPKQTLSSRKSFKNDQRREEEIET